MIKNGIIRKLCWWGELHLSHHLEMGLCSQEVGRTYSPETFVRFEFPARLHFASVGASRSKVLDLSPRPWSYEPASVSKGENRPPGIDQELAE